MGILAIGVLSLLLLVVVGRGIGQPVCLLSATSTGHFT